MNLNIFAKVQAIHRFFGLPAMTLTEQRYLKEILLSIRPPIEIFEYGTGHSTIFFAKFLKQHDITFHITTVDNDREWINKINRLSIFANVFNNIDFITHEFIPFWETRKLSISKQQEYDYVFSLSRTGKKFDLIFIDGRFRRMCLGMAHKSLKIGGVVFLHDAERTHYHCAMNHYKNGQFIDGGKYFPFHKKKNTIWVGYTK